MRILILGGTGVISTGIVRQLLERGDDLTLFNRGRTSVSDGRVTSIVGSRQSAADLAALAEGKFDAVIDMICYTDEDTELAIAAFGGKTAHYLLCSTVDVYTAPAAIYPLTEAHPRDPSPKFRYAWLKARAEKRFEAAAAAGAFGLTLLRPAATYVRNVVAPIGTTALYLDLLRRGRPLIMHGDGSTIWVATHRDDVARGFVGALGNPKAIGRAYNLASNEFITWERYWQIAADAIGAPEPSFVHIPTRDLVRLVPDLSEWCDINFQYHNIISSDAARQDLGFDPKISWRQGAEALRDLTALPPQALVARYEALLATWEQAMASMPSAVGDGRVP
jgi:nucleoside-diphosphate-sugar epimerase